MQAKGRLWEAYGSMIVALRHKMMALASRWGQVSVHHGYAKSFILKIGTILGTLLSLWPPAGPSWPQFLDKSSKEFNSFILCWGVKRE